MPSFSPEMMREIIMDHYNDPLHKKTPINPSEYLSVRMDSTSCIDDITVYLKVKDNKIVDALFDGVACTISTSSTDIMCDLVLNKTLDEALVFINTSKQAARIKCATIGWNGLEKIIEDECHHEKK